MEITVKNNGTGIIAFQHIGTIVSLGPGESFKSNLDFTVPEKQVIESQPDLEYTNSEDAPVQEVKTKQEPKKAAKVEEVAPAPEEEEEDLPEEEEVEEGEEEQAPEPESKKEEAKSGKKGKK